MNPSQKTWLEAFVRALVVAGSGVLLGFALYQSWVFTLTMMPFQFTMSSVTAALAYASAKSPSVRNGMTSLLVWYILLTWMIEEFNPWLLWLNATYIVGITAAVFVYTVVVQKRLFGSAVSRIVLSGALLAIANGLIIVILALITRHYGPHDAKGIWTLIVRNCEYGALIGLAVGCGIEISEWLIRKLAAREVPVDKPAD